MKIIEIKPNIIEIKPNALSFEEITYKDVNWIVFGGYILNEKLSVS